MAVLSLAANGGMPCPIEAQEAGRPEDNRMQQLQVEQATRVFDTQTRQKISSARKTWREGRHVDTVKQLEECLEQARKTLGEKPSAPSVNIVEDAREGP